MTAPAQCDVVTAVFGLNGPHTLLTSHPPLSQVAALNSHHSLTMFTIKVTYLGQTRKHTFSDISTFPSYDDICLQVRLTSVWHDSATNSST